MSVKKSEQERRPTRVVKRMHKIVAELLAAKGLAKELCELDIATRSISVSKTKLCYLRRDDTIAWLDCAKEHLDSDQRGMVEAAAEGVN